MKKTLVAIMLGMAMVAAIPSGARAAGKNNINEIKVIGVEVGGIVKAVKATAEGTSSSTSATATAAGATVAVKTANAGAMAEGTQAAATSNSGTSKAFIELLNAKRAEMGLNPIAWDENLAAEAQRRAQEITTNFDHDGFGGGSYFENIQSTGTSDINAWFEAWWNSEGHRIMMMTDCLDSGACAFVEVNGQYYITLIADGKPEVASAEEWQEQKEQGLEDGSLVIVDSNADGYAVYADGDGVEICTDEDAMS